MFLSDRFGKLLLIQVMRSFCVLIVAGTTKAPSFALFCQRESVLSWKVELKSRFLPQQVLEVH